MTTAARPTFDPARGYDSKAPTLQYSSRDLAAHTKLKFRQTGQLTKEELENLDLKEELLKAEREHFEKKQSEQLREAGAAGENQYAETRRRLLLETAALDKDDSDDDSDDDISRVGKNQKRACRRERKNEKMESAERQRQEEAMNGNPLLRKDFSVKRRWDDDVIFKNQARGVDDKPKKRFINDTLRSDFHRKFMNKYVK
ncbi:24341_t:CDS:2 [Dentiscutata erythropus]|uniref:24341_t:CDS:1 n=1 Tax=Dentiscutata erythropus TaxID=1348616 RepID=A0A9N8VPD9_9GLOM|nr:24341_t:CDS:2 [Dentiscutata erythropus]